MKIKAGEVKIINEGLKGILDIELPVKPAYWLARILNKMNQEAEPFEKARVNLVLKHAKKDKDGKPIFVKDAEGKPTNDIDIVDIGEFNKEFLVLANEEFEIDFKPIKLAELEGETCEKCGNKKERIKGSILVKLGNIVEM